MQLTRIVHTRSPRERVLVASAALIAVLAGALYLGRPELTGLAALAVSILALAFAVLALVKSRMVEFCPEVLGGDVILPRAAGNATRLLLPLQFSNDGYADGIIEWLALRLTLDGQTAGSVLLSPVGEVDMPRFIHAGRRLNDGNTIEPFTGFALEGKRALARFVLFDVAERPRAAPLQLQPGRYSFELFFKAGNSPRPRLARSFEHVLEPRQLEDHRNDSAVYLINYHVTLPAIRRALAESEWLPRADPAQASAR